MWALSPALCTYLAEHQINILDISQTIVQEYFNMMMIVDTSASTVPFETITGDLEEAELHRRQHQVPE